MTRQEVYDQDEANKLNKTEVKGIHRFVWQTTAFSAFGNQPRGSNFMK